MKVLITGVAGFIGMHLSDRLLRSGYDVVGIDNMDSHNGHDLKKHRTDKLKAYSNFKFIYEDIKNRWQVESIFNRYRFDYVIHLAAKAGVRTSLENPKSYVLDNVVGFTNIIESCKRYNVKHLIYASSSSVYGDNPRVPFVEGDPTDRQRSVYAVTKKTNELMAHTYSELFNLSTTGLRFFTVYGDWGVIGVVGREIRFLDHKFKVDIDFCLRTLQKDRILWKDNRFSFVQKRDTNKGGNSMYRTSEEVDKELNYLEHKWGKYFKRRLSKSGEITNIRVPRRNALS